MEFTNDVFHDSIGWPMEMLVQFLSPPKKRLANGKCVILHTSSDEDFIGTLKFQVYLV